MAIRGQSEDTTITLFSSYEQAFSGNVDEYGSVRMQGRDDVLIRCRHTISHDYVTGSNRRHGLFDLKVRSSPVPIIKPALAMRP